MIRSQCVKSAIGDSLPICVCVGEEGSSTAKLICEIAQPQVAATVASHGQQRHTRSLLPLQIRCSSVQPKAMSTWLSNIAESHRVQLAVTAVVSGALVGSAIVGLQTAKKQYKVSDLKDSIPSLKEEHEVGKVHLPSIVKSKSWTK